MVKRPGKRQHIRDLAGRNIPPSPPRAQRVQLTTAAELGQRLIPCPQTWDSDRPDQEQQQKQTRGPHRVTYPGHCGPIHPSSRVYRYIPTSEALAGLICRNSHRQPYIFDFNGIICLEILTF